MKYKKITNFDEVLEKSENERVIILKHSVTCPISANAKKEVDIFLEENDNINIYLVVVQEQREISNEIAERLKVKHESPQLLVIYHKKTIQVLNHYDITQENINLN